MKAQISFVEYLTAFIIFITFVGYFSVQLLKIVPGYIDQIRTERIRSEAYQISEILVNDPGEPLDWYTDPSSTIRVGLSDETRNKTNFLSLAKINALDTECKKNSYNGYYDVKRWLASDYDFSIILPGEIDCHPPSTAVKSVNVTLRRIVSFDSGYGELIIQMW
ncbi:MAG: hypothetical protein ACTSV6_07260 [Candidatus Heimdallarchaeota archaeon]